MWLLVRVVKGSKYFEAESRVENHVLLCDSSDMVISGRSTGDATYRFEARRGNENFVVAEFAGVEATSPLFGKFLELATRMGAVVAVATPAPT